MRVAVLALIGTLTCAAPCLAGGGASFKLLTTFSTKDVTVDEFGRTLVLTGGSLAGGYGDQYVYDADANDYTFIGVGWADRISADGTTVSGSMPAVDEWVEAVRWTNAGAPEFLGGLEGLCDSARSRGYGISGDGSTVVGLANNADCSSSGFVWTAADGMQTLELLNPDNIPQYNRATVISDDGQVIAGFAQGTFNRTPAMWNAADRSGSLLNVDAEGEFTAISPDGRILAGRYFDAETMLGIYPGFMPFFWTEQDGITLLPIVAGSDGGFVRGVSASGRTFVGSMGGGLPAGAMVIRPEWGAVALRDKLIELGVTNLGGANLVNAWAVSDDGTVVVGYATALIDEIIQFRGFVATLPEQEAVPCDEDLDGDDNVGFADLTQMLNAWGPCSCDEDFNGDGNVGFADLTQLLNAWGPCS